MTEDEKYKVIARLQNKEEPQAIAEILDLSYAGVLRFKKQYEQSLLNGTVDKLVDVDRMVLSTVGDQLGVDTTELTKGLDGLDKLSLSLQTTAASINTKINSLMLSCDTMSELEIAADILCKLQTAFLNKNLTQVNVQNNYTDQSTPKYAQYLSDVPAC